MTQSTETKEFKPSVIARMGKRLFTIAANLLLIVLSVYLTYYSLYAADYVASLFIPKQQWPGPTGILFLPGTEYHYKMHDYTSSEVINSLGFRDHEVTVDKGDVYRILAIGDSFTYGWGVNLEDTWCKQLESRLKAQGLRVEVLNLGKPAAGPPAYATIAETAVPLLKPDLVLVGVLAGDDLQQTSISPVTMIRNNFPNILRLIQHIRAPQEHPVPQQYLKQDAVTSQKNSVQCAADLLKDMNAAQRARYEQLEEPVRKAFLEGMLNPWLISHSTGCPDYFLNTVSLDAIESDIKDMSVSFRRIRRISEKNGAAVMALSIPEGFYVNDEAYINVQRIGFQVVPEMKTTDVPDEAVRQASERAGIGFCTATPQFRAHAPEKGLYFELDRHMSATGNALYAELVTPCVSEAIREDLKHTNPVMRP